MSDSSPGSDHPREFAWFNEWVSCCPMATISVVWNRTVDELAAVFAAGREAEAARRPSDRDPDPIGIGQGPGWTYVVEPSSTVGMDVLKAVSQGTEAVQMTFTATISFLTYARDGFEISGLDLSVWDIRHGQDKAYFDSEVAALESLLELVLPATAAAVILRDRLGVELTPEMLDHDLRWI